MTEEAKAEALEAEPPAAAVAEADDRAQPQKAERGELITPELLRALSKIVPAIWLVAVVACGVILGAEVAALVLAAGVLVLVITLMWSSVQSLTGGASLGFEEALGMGAPSRVEEQKRSVLRALKDLEYERSVGKISPEDYAELSARYREEAKRLIQSVDAALAPARQEVEQAIERRLARAGLAEVAPSSELQAPSEESEKEPEKQPDLQPKPPEGES